MNNMEKNKWYTFGHYCLLGLFMFLSVTMQTLANGGISVKGVSLLPAVAFVIGLGINYGPLLGGVFGLVTGLLLDGFTVPSVGFQVGILTILGIGCGLAAKHLFMHNRYARSFLCLCGSFVYSTAYFVVIKWICAGYDFSYFVKFSVPMIVAGGITGMVYTAALKWFRNQL